MLSKSFDACQKGCFSRFKGSYLVLLITNLLHVTNKDIPDMIQCAKDEAIVAVTELGMSVEGGKWEEMVLKPVATNDDDEDEDNDEGCAINDVIIRRLLVNMYQMIWNFLTMRD